MKKTGDIVSNDVPVAIQCVELASEATKIAREIERAFRACDSGEADEGRSTFANALEGVSRAPIAALMHHALRYALMIEMENLLPKMEVFQQNGADRPDLD